MELSPLATFIFPFRTAAVCSVILYIFFLYVLWPCLSTCSLLRGACTHTCPPDIVAQALPGQAQHSTTAGRQLPSRSGHGSARSSSGGGWGGRATGISLESDASIGGGSQLPTAAIGTGRLSHYVNPTYEGPASTRSTRSTSLASDAGAWAEAFDPASLTPAAVALLAELRRELDILAAENSQLAASEQSHVMRLAALQHVSDARAAVQVAAAAGLESQLSELRKECDESALAAQSLQHQKEFLEEALAEVRQRATASKDNLRDASADFSRIKKEMVERLKGKDAELKEAAEQVALQEHQLQQLRVRAAETEACLAEERELSAAARCSWEEETAAREAAPLLPREHTSSAGSGIVPDASAILQAADRVSGQAIQAAVSELRAEAALGRAQADAVRLERELAALHVERQQQVAEAVALRSQLEQLRAEQASANRLAAAAAVAVAPSQLPASSPSSSGGIRFGLPPAGSGAAAMTSGDPSEALVPVPAAASEGRIRFGLPAAGSGAVPAAASEGGFQLQAATVASLQAELVRVKRTHAESTQLLQAVHDEAQRFNRKLWAENASMSRQVGALQAEVEDLQAQAVAVAEELPPSHAPAASLLDRGTSAGGGEDCGAASHSLSLGGGLVSASAEQVLLRSELASSQQWAQGLQQALLERNLMIQQLSEQLVGVSDDVDGFEATVLRCEAAAAQLRAMQRMGGGRGGGSQEPVAALA